VNMCRIIQIEQRNRLMMNPSGGDAVRKALMNST
jgi:hypothetical protein